MEKILKNIYSSKGKTLALKITNGFTVIAFVLSYAFLLFYTFRESVYLGLGLFFSASIPFFIVSFVRAAFDAPRPYEIYDFYLEKPKEREGKSFPSRHAYSAFSIAVLSFFFCTWAGILLLGFAMLLSVSRVLLGIHFIRDVLAGGVIGIAAGAIAIAILSFL